MSTKRIVSELSGEQGIEVDLMYVKLGLTSFSKKQADAIFCNLAILAIQNQITACSLKLGKKYPSYEDVISFINSGKSVVDDGVSDFSIITVSPAINPEG